MLCLSYVAVSLACDGEAVLALMKGSFSCSLVLCLSYLLGCVACDGEAVLALVRGSFTCGLVLCLPHVARLCGLRWGGGASFGARLLCMWPCAVCCLCCLGVS